MITKFRSRSHERVYMEVERFDKSTFITIYTPKEEREVELYEEDLFDLIGQLLRIQSEIKKEVSNG